MRTAAARVKRLAARDTEERRERETSRPITLPVPTLSKRIKAELDRLYSDDEGPIPHEPTAANDGHHPRPLHQTEVTIMGTRREDYCYGQSAYMRADEWVGRSMHAYIEAVDDVEFEKGLKPVLKLKGQEKGLVVNATNYDVLADAFGSNPSKWPGHAILIEGVKVPFKGKRVDSIRVSVPPQPKQAKHPTALTDDLDDGVPDFPAA